MTNDGLPEPAAWLVESSLQWIADPARTPRAYTYVEMTRNDPEDGGRAPIYTADQLRAAIAQERDRAARIALLHVDAKNGHAGEQIARAIRGQAEGQPEKKE